MTGPPRPREAESAERSAESRTPAAYAPLTHLPRRKALVIVNVPGMVLVVSVVLGGAAQPSLVRDLSATHGGSYTLAFILASLLGLPLALKTAEVHGWRAAQLAVGICGLCGQVVTALAPTFDVALVGHAIAGLYTSAGPLCLLAMRQFFPRGRFLPALVTLLVTIGLFVTVSMVTAGSLLDAVGWRGTTWCLVALTAVVLALVATTPKTAPRGFSMQEMDVAGRLLVGSGPVFVTLGLLKGADWGWGSPAVLGSITAGVILGALAWSRGRSARHAPEPIASPPPLCGAGCEPEEDRLDRPAD